MPNLKAWPRCSNRDLAAKSDGDPQPNLPWGSIGLKGRLDRNHPAQTTGNLSFSSMRIKPAPQWVALLATGGEPHSREGFGFSRSRSRTGCFFEFLPRGRSPRGILAFLGGRLAPGWFLAQGGHTPISRTISQPLPPQSTIFEGACEGGLLPKPIRLGLVRKAYCFLRN